MTGLVWYRQPHPAISGFQQKDERAITAVFDQTVDMAPDSAAHIVGNHQDHRPTGAPEQRSGHGEAGRIGLGRGRTWRGKPPRLALVLCGITGIGPVDQYVACQTMMPSRLR